MKTKLADIPAGDILDALVALAQGWKLLSVEGNEMQIIISKTGATIDYLYKGHTCLEMLACGKEIYHPSTTVTVQWAELIEKFKCDVMWEDGEWGSFVDNDCMGINYSGATPQEAICKAVVASVYGDEIDVREILGEDNG